MKTISEMQQQVKEMSAKFDELLRDLSEYNRADTETTALDFKHIRAIGKRNPITGHILSGADNIVKRHYITLLIATIFTSGRESTDAWLLLQRIACGIGLQDNLEDISADAAQLTEEHIDEFTREIITAKLTQIFVLDTMLIYLSCTERDPQMLTFIAGLLELVKCSKQEAAELSELATVIIAQDAGLLLEFRSQPRYVNINQFNFYMDFFEQGILQNANVLCVFNETVDIESYVNQHKEYEQINLYNIVISGQPFRLSDHKKLLFRNCVFKDIVSGNGSIIGIAAEKTSMDNCTFSNISSAANYVVKLSAEETTLTNCLFVDIKGRDYSLEFRKVTAHNCTFKNIIGTETNSYTIYIDTGDIMANCKFDNIKGNYGIYGKNGQVQLLDCTLTNSSSLFNVTQINSK